MISYLRKAIERGINIPNIICFVTLSLSMTLCRFWGTLRLYCKSILLGVKIGKNCRAKGKVCFMRWPGGKISIGNGVSFVSSPLMATASTLASPVRLRVFGPGAAIEICDGAELSGVSVTARSSKITIGRHVMLAPNCIIVDSDFHSPWPPERRSIDPGYERDASVSIGEYVWVGMNSIILKGVNIGRGSIIAAGSVVTRSIPDNCLVAGVPATVVRIFPDVNKRGNSPALPGD